jgi:hypothetical protein
MRPLREIGGVTTVPGVGGIPPELHLLLKVITQCGEIILNRNWVWICG